MTSHVLVTGGLGFIGSHLCRMLLDRDPGMRLTIVDNLSSTKVDYSDLVGRAGIFIQDLRQVPNSDGPYDAIYHLASPVGSLGILEHLGHIATDILELAVKAAHLAAQSRARLLYVSSSEVYGRTGTQKEDFEQIIPCQRGARMEYMLGKLTAEHALLNLSSGGAFDLRIVRPFNVIGEWQSAGLGFVVPAFFEAALSGRPLQVFGTGKQKRAFCYVRDLVRGIYEVQSHGLSDTVYNIGNPGNLVAIEDLAQWIRELCQSNSKIEHVDPQALFGRNYIEASDKTPDISRVMAQTGWAPSIPLQEALRLMLHHFQERNSQNPVVAMTHQMPIPTVTA